MSGCGGGGIAGQEWWSELEVCRVVRHGSLER
jgi:hypothetical protein